jgi:hypothetical protein
MRAGWTLASLGIPKSRQLEWRKLAHSIESPTDVKLIGGLRLIQLAECLRTGGMQRTQWRGTYETFPKA